MTRALRYQRPDNQLPGAFVPHSLAVHNGLVTGLSALQFPIYRTDPNTNLRALTGTFEAPEVMVCEERETFQHCHGQLLGKLRSLWVWAARLRFNNLVLSDQVFEELAAEPLALSDPADGNSRIDRGVRAYLVSVEHEWRPSQDPGPGSSYTLRFEVRPY